MKDKITTSQILTSIRNADTFEEATEFHRQNKDPSFSDALYALMKKKNKTPKELILLSRIERSYFYHVLSGQKKPGRNMILRLTFCLKAGIEETNQMLRLGGYSMLYAKIHRDAVIIYGIYHKMSMDEVNDLLISAGQEPLYVEDKNG